MSGKVTYTKTKAGEWVVVGPVASVFAGHRVEVTKRDGTTKTETIDRVGRTFERNGETVRYGYLVSDNPITNPWTPEGERLARETWEAHLRDRCPTGGDCWSFAHIKHCVACGK